MREPLQILKRGVEAWNEWRAISNVRRPNLAFANLTGFKLPKVNLAGARLQRLDASNVDFSGANLAEAYLYEARLDGANFSGADLTGADLGHAVLRSTKFIGARLTGAELSETELRHADLSGANLRRADLLRADLSRANLAGADIGDCQLLATNLHLVSFDQVKGLGTVRHRGPSSISSQTIELNRGQISEVFLKGCGLKDWEILAARLHNPNLRADEIVDLAYSIANLRTEAPIVPRSIFISYSNKDMAFTDRLESRFGDDGIRSWRDVRDLVAGPMERQIDRAISIHGAVLLILSAASVESDWVRWEAERARKLEQELEAEAGRERRHRLCPVALDDSWKSCKWPGRLRAQIEDYNILDFSMWKSDEDAFEAQYQKLKTGLGIYYRK